MAILVGVTQPGSGQKMVAGDEKRGRRRPRGSALVVDIKRRSPADRGSNRRKGVQPTEGDTHTALPGRSVGQSKSPRISSSSRSPSSSSSASYSYSKWSSHRSSQSLSCEQASGRSTPSRKQSISQPSRNFPDSPGSTTTSHTSSATTSSSRSDTYRQGDDNLTTQAYRHDARKAPKSRNANQVYSRRSPRGKRKTGLQDREEGVGERRCSRAPQKISKQFATIRAVSMSEEGDHRRSSKAKIRQEVQNSLVDSQMATTVGNTGTEREMPLLPVYKPTAEATRKMGENATLTRSVVNLQRILRGCSARWGVARLVKARVALRGACFQVMMDIIDSYILEDVAPVIITGILAEGVEGVIGPIKVEEPSVPACQAILDEVVKSGTATAVKQAIREETDGYLDILFARNRRNPLLATVEDIISDSLRTCTREAVMEVVKEGTDDYLFGRRLAALVSEVIDVEVETWAASIAADVHLNTSAEATLDVLAHEVCSEEGEDVVAATMAPFENHLIDLQREKDVAAIQMAAHQVIVRGVQLNHAARTIAQRGRLVLMNEINGKTLRLLLAGRFLAILRAAEANRLKVSTSPLLSLLFRRLTVRAGRSVLLEELSRELDRDETVLHRLELERTDEVDRQRQAERGRTKKEQESSSATARMLRRLETCRN